MTRICPSKTGGAAQSGGSRGWPLGPELSARGGAAGQRAGAAAPRQLAASGGDASDASEVSEVGGHSLGASCFVVVVVF